MILKYTHAKVKIRELKFICGKRRVKSAWVFSLLLNGSELELTHLPQCG